MAPRIFGNGPKTNISSSIVDLPVAKLPVVRGEEPNYNPDEYAQPAHRSEYRPDLNMLAEQIRKVPIDDIAKALKALSYGEMIEFSELFVQAGKACRAWPNTINAESIAKIIHCLVTERLKRGHGIEDVP